MPISLKHAEVLLQQLQVLVVDDNAFMRAIVRGLLNNIGVKGVIEAGDGIAALDKIREETPDVVILDWEMPLLNGPELVRIVRSPGIFPTPDLPIIMLSAHGEQQAYSRIGQARRERVSVQAGVGQGAVRTPDLNPAQTARKRATRQILRSRPAGPGIRSAGRRPQQRAARGLTPACGLVAAAAAPARREEQVEQEPDRHDDQ